jgi:hypothetical protein
MLLHSDLCPVRLAHALQVHQVTGWSGAQRAPYSPTFQRTSPHKATPT